MHLPAQCYILLEAVAMQPAWHVWKHDHWWMLYMLCAVGPQNHCRTLSLSATCIYISASECTGFVSSYLGFGCLLPSRTTSQQH